MQQLCHRDSICRYNKQSFSSAMKGVAEEMSSLARTFCCLAAAFASCWIGFIMAVIFVPLMVPESLTADPSESTGVILIIATVLICAVAGFVLCWKFTARWVKNRPSTHLL